MTNDGDSIVALDIYLRTVSGRSLSEALADGHRLGDDIAEFAPLCEARDRVVKHVQELGGGTRVEAGGFVLRVHGAKRELERGFACRMTALGETPSTQEGEPELNLHEATPSEFAERLHEAVATHLSSGEDHRWRPEGPIEERWTPDPSLRIRFHSNPRLSGLDRWVEAIEPADRWPLHAERPEVVCEIAGHDWDILLFLSPFAVLECDRCKMRESSFPPSPADERPRS